MITYARAIHIYQNPYNLTETKCDVLISDGVIEHYDFNNHKDQKEIKKLIDHRTWSYDDRPKEGKDFVSFMVLNQTFSK